MRVELIRGDLSSVSTDQILSGANTAAIGDGTAENWEVFQFEQAEIVGKNTYELSMRLRGQAGTDGLMPDEWPVGSVFVLLNGVPEQINLASAARGVTQHYRFGPGTRPIADASYQYQQGAFSGVGLRPYRVVHLKSKVDESDIEVSWIRRTRVNGDSWDNEDVPISEASERYSIRVFRNGTLVRSDTSSSPKWTYSNLMRLFDGTLDTGELRFDVAQVSDIYGEGPSASITVFT